MSPVLHGCCLGRWLSSMFEHWRTLTRSWHRAGYLPGACPCSYSKRTPNKQHLSSLGPKNNSNQWEQFRHSMFRDSLPNFEVDPERFLGCKGDHCWTTWKRVTRLQEPTMLISWDSYGISYQDNTPAHKSPLAFVTVQECGFEFVQHPQNSELAPSGWYLFPRVQNEVDDVGVLLKSQLSSKTFTT